jgi:hypothetical protein
MPELIGSRILLEVFSKYGVDGAVFLKSPDTRSLEYLFTDADG